MSREMLNTCSFTTLLLAYHIGFPLLLTAHLPLGIPSLSLSLSSALLACLIDVYQCSTLGFFFSWLIQFSSGTSYASSSSSAAAACLPLTISAFSKTPDLKTPVRTIWYMHCFVLTEVSKSNVHKNGETEPADGRQIAVRYKTTSFCIFRFVVKMEIHFLVRSIINIICSTGHHHQWHHQRQKKETEEGEEAERIRNSWTSRTNE